MKTILLAATMFVLCVADATGQGKVLTNDPLTGLPLTPATDSGKHMANISYTYNEPTKMPDAQVCNGKMKANFYSLYDINVDAVVAWYSSHLSGFKKVGGQSGRSQTAFYNSDGTIVIIVTGNSGAKGENTKAYSVAYERYQPGISEKTIISLTQGKIVCQ